MKIMGDAGVGCCGDYVRQKPSLSVAVWTPGKWVFDERKSGPSIWSCSIIALGQRRVTKGGWGRYIRYRWPLALPAQGAPPPPHTLPRQPTQWVNGLLYTVVIKAQGFQWMWIERYIHWNIYVNCVTRFSQQKVFESLVSQKSHR